MTIKLLLFLEDSKNISVTDATSKEKRVHFGFSKKSESKEQKYGSDKFSDNLTLRSLLAAVDHWAPKWAYADAVNILSDNLQLVR